MAEIQPVRGSQSLSPINQTQSHPASQSPTEPIHLSTDHTDLTVRVGSVPTRAGRFSTLAPQSDDGDVDKFDNAVVHYNYIKAKNNSGKTATLHGVHGGWGTLIWEPTPYMKVSAEALLDTGFSKDGLTIGLGGALKNFIGLDFNVLGVGLPIGAYVKAGPQINFSRLQGDNSFGVGVSTALGVTIFGLDAEVTRTLATNRDDYGFRLGATIKF